MKVKVYTVKDLDTGFLYNFIDQKKMEQALELYPHHTITESITNIQYYIEMTLINEKGQSFEKGFDSLKEAKLFLNKVVRGSKLTVDSIFSFSASVLKELDYVLNYKRKGR